MKISLLQSDIAWNAPAANRLRLESMLRGADKSDVYVLPEMFTTGFAVDPDGVAEKDCATLAWMQQMAKELDAAICGSVATECLDHDRGVERDSHGELRAARLFFNRCYFVKPEGEYYYYDKRHLFTYGGEDRRYTRGGDRVVARFRGVRFLLQVCYDLRFPCFSRNRMRTEEQGAADDGLYDVALYVASWPTSRLEVWHTLLRARAIENQCYVAGVNRVGADMVCRYSGGTALIDPYGQAVAECLPGQEDVATCTIDLERLMTFRQKFPVLRDADK